MRGRPQDPLPDTRPGALLRHGLARGALLLLLPLVLAAQAVAWLAYAFSGLYRPWSWVKIGLAYALGSVRVPFEVRAFTAEGPVTSALVVAWGALTILVLVLGFRAGAMQARGLETRPARAALAGSLIAPGFALPLWAASFLVVLRFPNLDVDRLAPDPVRALVLPLVVSAVVGAVGGLSAARAALQARGGWRATSAGAARAAGAMLAWSLALAFVAFLSLAATHPDATGAYARFVGSGTGGAVFVLHHALLLPNQTALLLGAFAGSPATLTFGRAAITVGLGSIADPREVLVAGGAIDLPAWFWAFALVPLAGAFLGGRRVADDAARPTALARAALGGVGFAILGGVAVAAASIEVPVLAAYGASLTLGGDAVRTAALLLPFGLLGGVAGAWWASRPGR